MGKKETPIGNTHAAHESRHVARKMELVRKGQITGEKLADYESKLENERESLITRLKDCWSYLNESRIFDFGIPKLTKEQARKYQYQVGLEPEDFIGVSKLEVHYNYNAQAPNRAEIHKTAIILAACIRDLGWAIGEVKAHLETDK